MKATIEMMKQSRYREKKDFENMMSAMKHEDDIRRKLRNETIKVNKNSLEDQIMLNQRDKQEEARHLTSYSSGVKFMDNEHEK